MFEKKAVIFRFTSCPVAESAPGGANVRKAVEGMDCLAAAPIPQRGGFKFSR